MSLAGFKAPYVLMPHSASGIYSEYYAAKYPDEVSAIIMLDTTSTVKTEAKNPPQFLYELGKWQQACGVTRLANSLAPPAQKAANGYTAKEISDYRLFTNHVLNDTIIDQSLQTIDNINEVSAIAFPQEIPVLKLISSQTVKKAGADYQTKHLRRLGSNAESIIIDGTHFFYQTNVADICAATRTILAKINS